MDNLNKKTKTIAIIAGGKKSPLKNISDADFVIACDKGLNYALEEKIEPDLFVGDGDSFSGNLPKNVENVKLPKEKDDTDLMAAVKIALEKFVPEKLLFYCACGGRLDHFLGNLQAATFAAKRGVKVEIIDLYDHFFVFFGGENEANEEAFLKRDGYSFSVLSLTDKCEGVCISGAKYEIENATIYNDFPIGVSNEWINDEIRVSLLRGVLCVCICKMP